MADKLQVFLDTNVFIDYIQERPVGFIDAFSIFELSAKEYIHLLVTDLSISNMKYSTRKAIPTADFYATIKGIRELFTIVPVGEQAVDRHYPSKPRTLKMLYNFLLPSRLGHKSS